MNLPLEALDPKILVIAVAASMMLGGAWHGVFLRVDASAPRGDSDARSRGGKFLIFLTADVLTACLLAVVSAMLNLRGAGPGALLGAAVWLGLIAPSGLSSWASRRVGASPWMLDGGRQLLSLLAMGAILGAWS